MKGTRGKQIRDYEDLEAAASDKKAVIMPNIIGWCHRAHPAAFMIQQPAVVLVRLIRAGMFIYHKKKK
jgi:hypothetical protein